MTYLIAELGLNHNGDVDLAHKMIDVAGESGWDAVKVQSYRVEDIPWRTDVLEIAKKCEIWQHLAELRQHAREVPIGFGATPTSLDGIQELVELDVNFLKNGSDFLTRRDMIEAMAKTGIRTYVSTGMSIQADLEGLPSEVVFMHCTSQYPCFDRNANLTRIKPGWGFSDHTRGYVAAIAAAALGAVAIEKHITLDKHMEGPDHFFSLRPPQMRKLSGLVHRLESMMGTPEMIPTREELRVRDEWRAPVITPV